MPIRPKALLFWSSGKDSAWSLHVLRQRAELDVVGLATTFRAGANRVAMHDTRRELVEAQARSVDLPLWAEEIPWPCSNAEYEARLGSLLERARRRGITHVAFGDLFLEDIRSYREKLVAAAGLAPVFPLWTPATETPALARSMVAGGLRALITCVDPVQLSPEFLGREYDAALLAALPPSVDRCGERGEFHTLCYGGPIFAETLAVRAGERFVRDGFQFVDVIPCE